MDGWSVDGGADKRLLGGSAAVPVFDVLYFEAESQLITKGRVTMQRRSKLAQENEMDNLTYGGGGVTSLRMYLYREQCVDVS